jgi:hypothetical protein
VLASRSRSDGRVREGVEEPRYNDHDEAGMRGLQMLEIICTRMIVNLDEGASLYEGTFGH